MGVSLALCWEELEVSRSRLRGIVAIPLLAVVLVVVPVVVGCATLVATAVVAVVVAVGAVECVTLGLLLEIY